MDLRLTLLRHAKSSWDDAALTDHERPLNERGVGACALVAADLEAASLGIDLVLCSTAARTRETLDLSRHGLAGEPEVRFDREIYEASASGLFDLVRERAGEARSVLVIGHNPAIGSLAGALAGEGGADELAALRTKFPTAARATLGFDGEWSSLSERGAKLEAFVTPKQLR